MTSIAAGPGELPGFPLPQGTAGRLVVLRGVTVSGDAIANDPAAASARDVPRTYPRDAFERVWPDGSGGIATIVTPPAVLLPEGAGGW